MADYGVTDTGFKRKPKSVIITELENLMKAKFGQDLDVSPESPEGQIISVIADALDPMWETAQHSYNAFNPSAATGATLENLVKINNLNKELATASTVLVKFVGSNGITVPAGTTVSTNPTLTGGVRYKFDVETTGVISDGIYEVLAIAQEKGAVQVPINSVTVIDTPIVGITSVTNDAVGNVGQNDETDPQLRSRREVEVALPAVSTVDAIVAGIQNIESIISVVIYENDTAIETTEDGVTIPPHSLKIIIQGDGTDTEKESVANSVYIKKDPGIQTSGSVSWTLQDSQGFDKVIKWDTPTLVPLYIEILTDAESNSSIQSDGQSIKDALLAYVNDPVTGYKIGDNVSYARLFTPINSVPGHFVQSLKIGFVDPPVATSDLDVNGGSLVTLSESDIDIAVSRPL